MLYLLTMMLQKTTIVDACGLMLNSWLIYMSQYFFWVNLWLNLWLNLWINNHLMVELLDTVISNGESMAKKQPMGVPSSHPGPPSKHRAEGPAPLRRRREGLRRCGGALWGTGPGAAVRASAGVAGGSRVRCGE